MEVRVRSLCCPLGGLGSIVTGAHGFANTRGRFKGLASRQGPYWVSRGFGWYACACIVALPGVRCLAQISTRRSAYGQCCMHCLMKAHPLEDVQRWALCLAKVRLFYAVLSACELVVQVFVVLYFCRLKVTRLRVHVYAGSPVVSEIRKCCAHSASPIREIELG